MKKARRKTNKIMETNIQIFNNAEFGEIRTVIMSDGRIGFVGKDVAEVLGYNQSDKAINRHVDEDDRMKCTVIDSLGRNQMAIVINESGLYALILASKLPKARNFKHWVTDDVLPKIRQTGAYLTHEKMMEVMTQPESVMTLCKHLIALDEKVTQLMPLAEYAEDVLLSSTCYTMTEVAKSLSMTVQQLQHTLHEKGIIYRSPAGIWMLYADYLKHGYEAYRTSRNRIRHNEPCWTDTYLVWTECGKKFVREVVKTSAQGIAA